MNNGLSLEPGEVFADRYTIVERIGQGGMGVVYLATEELAGKQRKIALKLIRADRLADQRAIDKLINEGALTQDIRHPNVVAVYNVGESGGKPFVAMDYVEGHSLREWHRRKINAREEISLPVVGAIIGALLDGLEAAHALGIVHRDLKPENVILTDEPSDDTAALQILDFGIAHTPGTSVSATGTGLGTPRYMAPEQITNPDGVEPSADLYSLSVIFYELLMDVLPQGHWQPPSGGRPDISVGIDQIIETGLSNRPATRQQSVAEYRQQLNAVLADAETEIDPPLPPPVNPDRKRARNILVGAGGGMALLIGAVMLIPDEDYTGEPSDHWTEEIGPDGDAPVDEAVDGSSGSVEPLESNRTPREPDIPPEQPSTYAALSGGWAEHNGGYFEVAVQPNGYFTGRGHDAEGIPVLLEGNIPTQEIAAAASGMMYPGQLKVNDACHISFTVYNADGSTALASQFHIGHVPDNPCPPHLGGM